MRTDIHKGFTLVELLVVIAIIATIIAIVLPSLAKARSSSRTSACLSNHRQLALAWNTYTTDYKVFPYGEVDADYKRNERRSWGGVNWFGDNYPTSVVAVARRPVNLYLAGEYDIRHDLPVVHCPSDSGTYQYDDRIRTVARELVSASSAPDPDTTYGTLGTSYAANDWQYCRPGARQGWGPPPAFINHRSTLGFQHVTISPSRFVILGDIGSYGWMISTEQQRMLSLSGAWWHGKEVGAMSFLDGSARLEKSGRIVNSRYSMYMVPVTYPNLPSDYRFPGFFIP